MGWLIFKLVSEGINGMNGKVAQSRVGFCVNFDMYEYSYLPQLSKSCPSLNYKYVVKSFVVTLEGVATVYEP